MEATTGFGLITSIFGGVIVSAANWIFMGAQRDKTRAEAEKARAEAAKTRAETTELMKQSAPRQSVSSPAWGELPPGWSAGDLEGASDNYVVGVDRNNLHSGHTSVFIRAKTDEPEGFGALSQRFSAKAYAGQRLRLTGYLRVDSVTDGWSGLWMRIDRSDGVLLGFDNMEKRPVRGTSDWLRREVILDVPPEAYAIGMGGLLVGVGSVWIADLAIDIVDTHTPTTVEQALLPAAPTNLKFVIDEPESA